jgi:hypothetical protein
MHVTETNEDAEALALQALGWVLAKEDRAERLLALTGLEPDGLRARIGEPALLGSILAFLEGHEPDLIACAEDLGVKPERLVAAAQVLN